jgi:nicotinate-nucleotide pyrophosphorylase (carboxylating)
MLTQKSNEIKQDIQSTVTWALKEDLGLICDVSDADFDITAMLIPEKERAVATVITRENCVICGVDWVNEVFSQLDALQQKKNKIKSTARRLKLLGL